MMAFLLIVLAAVVLLFAAVFILFLVYPDKEAFLKKYK